MVGENIRSFTVDIHPLVLKYHNEHEIKNNLFKHLLNSQGLYREEDKFVNNVIRYSNIICVFINIVSYYFNYESLIPISIIVLFGSFPIHHYSFRMLKVRGWI